MWSKILIHLSILEENNNNNNNKKYVNERIKEEFIRITKWRDKVIKEKKKE